MSIETVTAPVEWGCPICGKTFSSKTALNGHQFAHRGPEACPECGAQFKPGISMARHRENLHGVVSEREQRRRRAAGQAVAPANPAPKKDAFDWKADDIFQAAITMLWPNGVVPIHAVLPLIQWREDTKTLVEKIR